MQALASVPESAYLSGYAIRPQELAVRPSLVDTGGNATENIIPTSADIPNTGLA